MKWRGVPIWKTPSDMWIYQEIVTEIRPTRIVEFGTAFGGSALFYADMLDLLNIDGEVLTVDIDASRLQATHPRLRFLLGDPASQEIAAEVRAFCNGTGPVLLIDDSDHSYQHVHDELNLYHDLVTPGSCFVVEDGGMGYGLQDEPSGVVRACFEFLQAHPEFQVDWTRNRFGHTTIYGGFLRKVIQ